MGCAGESLTADGDNNVVNSTCNVIYQPHFCHVVAVGFFCFKRVLTRGVTKSGSRGPTATDFLGIPHTNRVERMHDVEKIAINCIDII